MRVQLLIKRILPLVLILALCLGSVCAEDSGAVYTDYAAKAHLMMNGPTLTQEVTVKLYVDGDTTHFYVPSSVSENGVLKARYIGINTPETTGKIEEYGKAASRFTRDKLENAASIVVESDNGKWNIDSTGSRTLVWVWYRNEGEMEYRNLNIELLQNGLAIANSSANNRYGDLCLGAIAQAREMKLNVYSGKKDPDFYYGDAVELTLRELRLNAEAYNGVKVAFSGIITVNSGNSVYVESMDEETGLSFGMSVYYGYGLNGAGLDILSVGNEARIVGTMQYYEAGDSWQVSGLSYRMMKPKDPGNIQKLSGGHEAPYTEVTAAAFSGDVTIVTDEGEISVPYAETALATTVTIPHLTVTGVHCSQEGEWTIYCEQDGIRVQLYAPSLEDGYAFVGHTYTVKGVADRFSGRYQVRIFTVTDLIEE